MYLLRQDSWETFVAVWVALKVHNSKANIFKPRIETGRGHFACQDSGLHQFEHYLTIRPVALSGYGEISPWGEAQWAIDPWPLRAKGLIVLVSPN